MNIYKALNRAPASDKRKSLYEYHDDKIQYFSRFYERLPEFKKELERVDKWLKNNKKSYENIDYKVKKKRLLKDIEECETKNGLHQYLMIASPFFLRYEKELKNPSLCNSQQSESISSGLSNFVTKEGVSKCGQILKEYLEAIGNGDITQKKKRQQVPFCNNCHQSMLLHPASASAVCDSCGLSVNYQDIDSTPQWSEEVEQISQFAYKRINHFIDWLSRLQAKESTVVPQTVIAALLKEFKKARIIDPKDITPKRVKSYLKKLRLNKYYDNTTNIICILSGKKAPKMTPILEEKLKHMFMKIQTPFEKHKLPTRTNFLSYSFVLHKMCQIIGMDDPSSLEFLEWFPLLKSREKLWLQDKVWKGICEELSWPFVASI